MTCTTHVISAISAGTSTDDSDDVSMDSAVPPPCSLAHMTDMDRRSLLERLVGRPLPWVAWAYAGLAVVWVVLAVVEPSGLHTFMAILWPILAAVQISSAWYVRRQDRNRAGGADSGHGAS